MRSSFETLTDWTVKGEGGDGAEAIQKAIDLRPDLILMDFSMPNMNGVQAASVLKNIIPDVHHRVHHVRRCHGFEPGVSRYRSVLALRGTIPCVRM
jgi:DNA-binding NarL/FixJ family response regulator